jgi:hypothetical protein
MKEAELFRSIPVWHGVSRESAVLYECLESLTTRLFTVWVATPVRLPLDGLPVTFPTPSFVERFIEHDDALAEPDEQTEWFATLQEAIEAHRRDFDDEYFVSAIPGYREDLGYD